MILYLVLILPAYLANKLQLKLHLLPLQDQGGGWGHGFKIHLVHM